MNPLRGAIDLIKRFEGIPDGDPTTVNLDPYLDPVGIWTIGWGHVVRDHNGKAITGKESWKVARSIYPNGLTKKEAEILLRDDIRVFIAGVRRLVKVPLLDGQWSALISFTFNVGLEAFENSTMLKHINGGELKLAAKEFPRWNKSKGKVLAGLTRRRAAEAACFEGK